MAERDRVLLERMRHERAADRKRTIAELTHLRCPTCGAHLAPVDHHEVSVDECPACGGIWLDQGELETLARRERDSWLGRFFYRPKR